MYDYKSNFSNALEYGYLKSRMAFSKTLVMGIMASIYVGIAYIVYIQMASVFLTISPEGEISVSGHGWIIASLIFPVGLIMITLLGGSLFTSDTLVMLAYFDKRARLRRIALNLVIVLLGNIIGGFIVAAIARGGNIFNEKNLMVIQYLATHKSFSGFSSLYSIFFSAIFCNIIVAGTVWSTLATRGATGKILIIFLFIWLFTISGFQHVIANMIVFSFAWLHADVPYTITQTAGSTNEALEIPRTITKSLYEWINANTQTNDGLNFDWTIKAFAFNFLPALVGNLIAGAILLPSAYWFLVRYKAKKYGTIDPEVIHDINFNQILKQNPGINTEDAQAEVEKMELKEASKDMEEQNRK